MLFVLFFNADTHDVETTLPRTEAYARYTTLVMSPSPPGRGFYDAVDHFHASTPGLYALVLNGTRFDDHAATPCSTGQGTPNFDARSSSPGDVSPPEANVHDRLSFAFFDVRDASRAQAALNMCRTVFVCVVLGVGALCSVATQTLSAQTHRAHAKKVGGEREPPDEIRYSGGRDKLRTDGDEVARKLHRQDL